jgi:hypothetical protein
MRDYTKEKDWNNMALKDVLHMTKEIPINSGGLAILLTRIVHEFDRIQTQINDL